MKIYLTTPMPPELASHSAAERKRIWAECSESLTGTRAIVIQLLSGGLCAGLGAFVGDLIGPGYGIWGSGIGGAIGGFTAYQIRIRQTLRVVRERYRTL